MEAENVLLKVLYALLDIVCSFACTGVVICLLLLISHFNFPLSTGDAFLCCNIQGKNFDTMIGLSE